MFTPYKTYSGLIVLSADNCHIYLRDLCITSSAEFSLQIYNSQLSRKLSVTSTHSIN